MSGQRSLKDLGTNRKADVEILGGEKRRLFCLLVDPHLFTPLTLACSGLAVERIISRHAKGHSRFGHQLGWIHRPAGWRGGLSLHAQGLLHGALLQNHRRRNLGPQDLS